MMKTTFAVLMMMPLLAMAETGPFGTVIGKSSLADVRNKVAQSAQLEPAGTSSWNGGPIYTAPGQAFPLDGLKNVVFVFDTQDTLAAVELTLDKFRYPEIKRMLAKQYPLKSDQAPFVGNQHASFRQGTVIIDAQAPHMSFEMTVTYAHRAFNDAMKAGLKAQESARRQREESAL